MSMNKTDEIKKVPSISNINVAGLPLGTAIVGTAMASMVKGILATSSENINPFRKRWFWLKYFYPLFKKLPICRLRNKILKWCDRRRVLPESILALMGAYLISKFGKPLIGDETANLASTLLTYDAVTGIIGKDKIAKIIKN